MTTSTLTHDRGVWTWNEARTHEAGATFVPVGTMSGWWAHMLEPSQPIAWQCDEFDGAEAFASAFGQAWVRKASQALGGEAADPTPLQPPRVDDSYARVAVVRSIAAWYPEPIDEAALLIDEALAWHDANVPESAKAALTAGATALVSIADAMWQARQGEALATIPMFCQGAIESAVEIALQLLPDDDEDKELLGRIASRQRESSRDGIEATDAISAFLAQISLPTMFHEAHLVAGGAQVQDQELAVLPVAPGAVTPRTLAWRGPLEPELSAQRVGDDIVVKAELASGMSAYSVEASSLVAFACDQESGEVVARALMEQDADSHTVSALLAVPEGARIAIGIFEIDRVEAVRTDRLGEYLSRLERISVARWVALRKRILAVAVGGSSAKAVALTTAAQQLLDECEDLGLPLINEILDNELVPRDSIGAFKGLAQLQIRGDLDPQDAVFGPTIAEGLILADEASTGGH